jgi:thiol-disulfide isomerase/thioredoxin
MKKALCLFLLLFSITTINAQKPDTVKGVPHFKLLKPDSTYTTDANLKKGHAVMVIYFAPDCPHCQKLTYEFQDEFKKEAKAHKNTLRNIEIVMATYTELKAIQVFYRDFGLVKYPNITLGTEGRTYTLLTYYHVGTTPYIAIYSKAGKLVKTFDKPAKIEDVMAELKKV